EKKRAQRDRIVMFGVARGVKQGDRPLARNVAKLRQRFLLLLQFLGVAAQKLRPALRPMAEPFAQLRARRELLAPFIDGGALLAQTARPQPVDENAQAVLRGRRVIDPL